MLNPTLHLLAAQPQWFAEHIGAYAQLAGAELGDATQRWRRQALLGVLSAVALGVGATLAGVATLLWVVMSAGAGPSPLAQAALVVVPALPLLVGAAGLWILLQAPPGDGFALLRQHWEADLALLRAGAAP